MLRIILLLVVVLCGCSTTQKPHRKVQHIGDGWLVAGYNNTTEVLVQAKQIKPVQYKGILLDKWIIRLVNSTQTDVCVNINFMLMDYNSNIQRGWYHLSRFDTKYVGELTQQPWQITNEVFAMQDAKWVVNNMEVVPYEDGCIID